MEKLSSITAGEIKKAVPIIVNHVSKKGKTGHVHLSTDPHYILDTEVNIVRTLIDEMALPVVVVSLTKPYYYVHRALSMETEDTSRVVYVDAISNIAGSLLGAPTIKNRVFMTDGPFDPEDIVRAVKDAVGYQMKRYDSPVVVYVDNLLQLGPYMGLKSISYLSTSLILLRSTTSHYGFLVTGKINRKIYQEITEFLRQSTDLVIDIKNIG